LFEDAEVRVFTQKVMEYHDTYRHPRLPPLKVEDLYDLKSWAGKPPSYRPGCYAIFSISGSLLYIGKASHAASVGSRLAAHLRKIRPEWIPLGLGHILIVTVDEPFEAPSLEEFLIHHLQPPLNDRGRRRTPPTYPN
jgi:excinuclease UvrABC nuclease subunit